MRNLIGRIFFIGLMSAVLPACETAGSKLSEASAVNPAAPYYRFWRGFKQPDLTQAEFLAKLGGTFMPATLRIMGPLGLRSYVVATPPADKGVGIPDEMALLRYDSQAAYDQAMATAGGQDYAKMHWQVFDKKTSRSVAPLSWSTVGTAGMQDGAAYDLIGAGVDWQTGGSFFFLGVRGAATPEEAFLGRLTAHVRRAKEVFGRHGVRGYVALGTKDYEIAYLNWASKDDFDAALADAEGKALVDDAGRFMETAMFVRAQDFTGTASAGQFFDLNVSNTKSQ